MEVRQEVGKFACFLVHVFAERRGDETYWNGLVGNIPIAASVVTIHPPFDVPVVGLSQRDWVDLPRIEETPVHHSGKVEIIA